MQSNADSAGFVHGEVVGGEFSVPCCDAPELLDFVEGSLDAVAQAVEGATKGMGRVGAATVRDDGQRILGLDHLPDPFRVVGLVTEHKAVGRHRRDRPRWR